MSEALSSYDDVSEMVFTRFSCQMEYELVAEFPTYEEWYSQMTLCGDTNQSDSKSGDEESTSSKPQIESSMVNLFPNPNSGHFFLELTGEVQDVQLNIYDLKGRKLGQVVNFKGGAIDLSNLTGGVYILQVYDGTRYEQVRISIIK